MRTKRVEDQILEEQKRREEEDKRKKREEVDRKRKEEEEERQKEAERRKKEEVAAALAAAKCKVTIKERLVSKLSFNVRPEKTPEGQVRDDIISQTAVFVPAV